MTQFRSAAGAKNRLARANTLPGCGHDDSKLTEEEWTENLTL